MFRSRSSISSQVADKLLNRITSGEFDALGGRIPSEHQLSEGFGVSRSTIRHVITQLQTQGILSRRQGVGTFINRPLTQPLFAWPDEKSSFLQLIRQAGHEPSVRLISCGIGEARGAASRLGLNENDSVYHISKVLYSDERPVILVFNSVPLSLILPEFVGIVKKAYQCEESVYTFVTEKCARNVEYHDSELSAVPADARVASTLNAALGSPVLKLEEVAYDRLQEPLFHDLSFLRSDLVAFRLRRGLSLWT